MSKAEGVVELITTSEGKKYVNIDDLILVLADHINEVVTGAEIIRSLIKLKK